jgi:VanZ family protein
MKPIHRSILSRWLLVLFYCLAIFILSSNTSPKALPRFDYADKLLHFAAFVILGILFFRAWQSPGYSFTPIQTVSLTLVSSTLFGILIEIQQYYLPHRKAEAADIAADVAGCILGVLLCLTLIRKKTVPGIIE